MRLKYVLRSLTFPCVVQVNVDNIDRDLFGTQIRGAMYQPVDETLDKYKKAAYVIVRDAYADNVVRTSLKLA